MFAINYYARSHILQGFQERYAYGWYPDNNNGCRELFAEESSYAGRVNETEKRLLIKAVFLYYFHQITNIYS